VIRPSAPNIKEEEIIAVQTTVVLNFGRREHLRKSQFLAGKERLEKEKSPFFSGTGVWVEGDHHLYKI
jgi:hypothetical protein